MFSSQIDNQARRDCNTSQLRPNQDQHTHTHLSVLGASDVHQGLGSRMDHIQQLQDGGAIIGDGGLTYT